MKKIKNLFRNRYFMAFVSIFVSMCIGLCFNKNVNNKFNSKIPVVRVKKDVLKGSQLSKNDLETVEMVDYNLSKRILENEDDVVGKFVVKDLFADDILTQEKVSNENPSSFFVRDLNGKKSAMSVTLKSLAAGLSGKLEPGDIISIVTNTSESMGNAKILPELKYVKVLAISTSSGDDLDEAKKKENVSESEKNPVTLTVLVNCRQAELLADAENENCLHATLVFRGDPQIADKFLDQQEKFFKERNEVNEK